MGSTILSGILVVGVAVFVAVIAAFAVRRLKSYPTFAENNEFASVTYPILGLIYGVFLAFAVILAWEKFSEAESCVVGEVIHLSGLWRNAQVFDDGHRDQIENNLYTYATAVKEKEWKTMAAAGKADKDTKSAYRQVWNFYYNYEPRDDHQMAFFSESLSNLNEISRYRRQRIMFSSYEIPGIMWVFVVVGGIITVFLNYLLGTRNAWAQTIINALITAFIAFSIFLVYSLQHPFSGDVSISKAPFETLSKSFEERINVRLRSNGT